MEGVSSIFDFKNSFILLQYFYFKFSARFTSYLSIRLFFLYEEIAAPKPSPVIIPAGIPITAQAQDRFLIPANQPIIEKKATDKIVKSKSFLS